jgi:O-antigen/teichoic acid export membrane protein
VIAESTKPGVSPIVRNILAMAAGQCATWVASTLTIILLPRFLGSADLGRYSLALLCAAFMNLASDLGVSTYLAKQIPREDQENASRLAWNSIGLGLAMSSSVTIVAAMGVYFLVRDATTQDILFLMLLLVPIQAVYVRMSSALRGAQDMAPSARAEGFGRWVAVVLIVGIFMSGRGVEAVCLATVSGALVTLLIGGIAFRRRFKYALPAMPPTWKLLTIGGLPFLVWQASLQIYGQIDILILSLMSSDSAVGWYAAAYRLISIPVFAPAIIAGAAFPAISAAAASGDAHRVSEIARNALRASLLIAVPMSFGMAVLAGSVVNLLGYPADFENTIPLISILAIHVPIVAVTMVVASCLNAMDKHWSWVKVGLAAAILNPFINIPMVSLTNGLYDNGAIGAAVVTLATEVLMLAGGLLFLPRHVLGKPALGSTLRVLIAGAAMALALLAFRRAPLLEAVILGAIVYLLAALLTRAITLEECKHLAMHLQLLLNRERAGRLPPHVEVIHEAAPAPRG